MTKLIHLKAVRRSQIDETKIALALRVLIQEQTKKPRTKTKPPVGRS